MVAESRTTEPPVRAGIPVARVPPVDLVAVASVCAVLLTLGAVTFATLGAPIKDDVAWLLHVARDWLHGRRLYVDIVEINPPLIVWLSAIPVLIADFAGASATSVAVVLAAAFMLGCAWWCAVLLRGYSPLFQRRAPAFAAISVTLLAVPGGDFAEREHLLVAGALPYLCLLARRLGGSDASTRSEVLIGFLAGAGCALKPTYGLAFTIVGGVAALRGARPRAEVASFLAVLLSYGVAILALYPEYFSTAAPLAVALYGANDPPLGRLLGVCRTLIFGDAVALVLLLNHARPPRSDKLFMTLVVFGCGATLTCLVEAKDWFYHQIPGTVAITLALLYWIAAATSRAIAPARHARLGLAVSACALGTFGYAALGRLTPRMQVALAPEMTTEANLERLILHEGSRSYMAFSQFLWVAFPVVDDVGVTWTSRFDSMWALRGQLYRAQREGDQTESNWPIRQWVTADFLAYRPDLVVVDDRDGLDYLGVLTVDDAFARAWAEYRQIATIDALRIFSRQAASSTVEGR
jgi:hypothetical protein